MSIRDDCFIYYEKYNIDTKHILEWLENNTYYGGRIYDINISRRQKWYQRELGYFSPSWKKEYERWKAHPYDEILNQLETNIQKKVDCICNTYGVQPVQFNSCLVNVYENGEDLIKEHSDSQPVFGKEPVVCILSFGDTRTLVFTDKQTRKDVKHIELKHSSICIMAGKTQDYYLHSIRKEQNKKKRYSLTFREYNIKT